MNDFADVAGKDIGDMYPQPAASRLNNSEEEKV